MQKTLLRKFARKIKRPEFLEQKFFNFNFEENREYISKLEAAYNQRDELNKKLNEPVKEKRESRIRKDMNSDITDYYIWREFDYNIEQKATDQMTHIVRGKIELKPNELITAFGMPLRAGPEFYKATSVYIFQDSFLDTYYIYDHHPENITDEYFEFYKTFWQSEEPHEFRISHTRYANRYKFKKLVYKMVEDVKNNPEHAFDVISEKKHGKPELYDEYGVEYTMNVSPPVFRHNRKEFDKYGRSKMDYMNDKEYDAELKPAVDIRKDPKVELVE